MLRIEFQMEPKGVLGNINDELNHVATIEFDSALPVDKSRWIMFVTVTGSGEMNIGDHLDSISGLQLLHAEQFNSRPISYHVLVYIKRTPSILTVITRNEGVPHRLVVEGQQLRGIVSVRDWAHLKEIAEALEATYGSFELFGTTEADTIGYPLGGDKMKYSLRGKLTEEQIKILEKAYRMGYFQVPQTVTGEEVAEELDISRSTLSERLRRTENNLCEILFGGSTE
jgi:predicted DNA binding protein